MSRFETRRELDDAFYKAWGGFWLIVALIMGFMLFGVVGK